MCCSCWIFKPRNYDAWNRPSTTSPRYALQQIRYLCMGFESSAKKVNSDFSSLIAALSIKWTKIGFSSLDKSYSSTVKGHSLLLFSVIIPNCTMAHSCIIKTDRYGGGMDHAGAANPPQSLISPTCFISSPLSLRLCSSVCTSCGHPACQPLNVPSPPCALH